MGGLDLRRRQRRPYAVLFLLLAANYVLMGFVVSILLSDWPRPQWPALVGLIVASLLLILTYALRSGRGPGWLLSLGRTIPRGLEAFQDRQTT